MLEARHGGERGHYQVCFMLLDALGIGHDDYAMRIHVDLTVPLIRRKAYGGSGSFRCLAHPGYLYACMYSWYIALVLY